MSDGSAPTPAVRSAWGMDLATASCSQCKTSFLVNFDTPPVKCPLCYHATLEIAADTLTHEPFPYAPELVLPFRLSDAQLAEKIRSFASGIPFAPPGLNQAELRARLTTIYLPMWLVDSLVSAYWQAEAGFDYQVISHRESYDQIQAGWTSREVKEQRVRWENRLGRLNRGYQNIPAPALNDAVRLEITLGKFQLDSAQSYDPDCIRHAFIRMPDRTRQDSWGEAVAAFQKTAAEDCQRACSADRMRQFRWTARFSRQNWTLMLLPMYSTFYLDDDGQVQPVLIHGQTGAVAGGRRSSERRAERAGLYVLIIGALLFLSGILLNQNLDPTSNLAYLTTFLAATGVATILAACIPTITAWDFNRRQKLEEYKS